MDQEKIKTAVKMMLEAIGEDPEREGLTETPDRIARMCEEIFGGMNREPKDILSKRFKPQSGTHGGMVLVKDIPFYSMCEHHMLPFYGVAHVAYIPDGEVVGLSKIARLVELYARRLQLQEQLTAQIADALMKELSPKGVMVMLEGEHMCMSMRGINKPGSTTVSTAVRGVFGSDETLAEHFYTQVRK
ncbi:MAG: GTP cyclohydrolase I FolE [Lachnospiraceae bacterium]|nr:GTP cyclohydrolase I FolE [Lachnospiraceae bacterium]